MQNRFSDTWRKIPNQAKLQQQLDLIYFLYKKCFYF